MLKDFINFCKCSIGLHKWQLTLGTAINLRSEICEHCGQLQFTKTI